MTFDPAKDVCFVGLGASAVSYYRCILPALALGSDWCGVVGEPPELLWRTGLISDGEGGQASQMPDLSNYKVIVVQQPKGKGWLEAIKMIQDRGVKVLFEVDDYLHGIKHMKDHDFKDKFGNKELAEYEAAMKACDGLICSTEWIESNYRHFNKRTYICENGIDLRRYELGKPKRDTVNIGWAGATGHLRACVPWFQQTANIMRMRPNTCFVSVGQDFASGFAQHFGEQRAIAVPWAAIEQYPGAMTMFDIALAPGGAGGWWRGKSDLRWLEAGALGIPVVANPEIYPNIEDGVTGFHAGSDMEAGEKILALVDDKELRTTVGRQAQEFIRENRSSEAVSVQWVEAFKDILGEA